jgi:hypothetical protein
VGRGRRRKDDDEDEHEEPERNALTPTLSRREREGENGDRAAGQASDPRCERSPSNRSKGEPAAQRRRWEAARDR